MLCPKNFAIARWLWEQLNGRPPCASYYLLRGPELNDRLVMDAINTAKRRFFLRPRYIARHAGDVVKLALSKQAIVRQVLSRTVFGSKVVDIKPAGAPLRPGTTTT